VYPGGHASRASGQELGLSFAPAPDHAGIAAASGGAWARTVTRPREVSAAIAEALEVVRKEQRCAVLDVKLAQI
jgi:acetolactate synthase-1/2/3 large subunit